MHTSLNANGTLSSIPAFLSLITALRLLPRCPGEADTESAEPDTKIIEVAAELTAEEDLIVKADLINQTTNS